MYFNCSNFITQTIYNVEIIVQIITKCDDYFGTAEKRALCAFPPGEPREEFNRLIVTFNGEQKINEYISDLKFIDPSLIYDIKTCSKILEELPSVRYRYIEYLYNEYSKGIRIDYLNKLKNELCKKEKEGAHTPLYSANTIEASSSSKKVGNMYISRIKKHKLLSSLQVHIGLYAKLYPRFIRELKRLVTSSIITTIYVDFIAKFSDNHQNDNIYNHIHIIILELSKKWKTLKKLIINFNYIEVNYLSKSLKKIAREQINVVLENSAWYNTFGALRALKSNRERLPSDLAHIEYVDILSEKISRYDNIYAKIQSIGFKFFMPELNDDNPNYLPDVLVPPEFNKVKKVSISYNYQSSRKMIDEWINVINISNVEQLSIDIYAYCSIYYVVHGFDENEIQKLVYSFLNSNLLKLTIKPPRYFYNKCFIFLSAFEYIKKSLSSEISATVKIFGRDNRKGAFQSFVLEK